MEADSSDDAGPPLSPECIPPKKRLTYGMKRKCPSPGISKKAKIETEHVSETELTMLPDDVLLEILKNCDHHTLYQMNKTCRLFARLVQDFSLWRKVVFTEEHPRRHELSFIAANITDNTKLLHIHGNFTNVLSSRCIKEIFQKCQYLETVKFINEVVNAAKITIDVFPKTLTTLDLSRSNLINLPIERSYFKDICKYLPNLKNLYLSECDWFEPHSLMAISKCKKLEVLVLSDCDQVRDCLAYCGLSTRAGFPALVTLDLRRCAISNSELVCFSSIKTLKNLYLENNGDAHIFIDSALTMMCTYHQNGVDGEVRVVQKVRLERLIVRHYQLKFSTLRRLADYADALKFIDITGAGIGKTGIQQFKSLRPDVTLVAEDEEQ